MAKVVAPNYPDALTVKFWNKAKGLIARVTKVQTGITKQLEDAKAAFDKAPFKDLEMNNFLSKHVKTQGTKTPKEIDDLLRLYLETNHKHFKDLEGKFYSLSTFLRGKAREFEADAKTKSFAKAVAKMADEANKFTYAISFGTLSSKNQAEFAKMRKDAETALSMKQNAAKKLITLIGTAEAAIKKGLSGKGMTLSQYTSLISEELRGIGAQITLAGLKTEFAVPMNKVKVAWSQGGMPKSDQEVKKHLEQDLKLVAEFKKVAAVVCK